MATTTHFLATTVCFFDFVSNTVVLKSLILFGNLFHVKNKPLWHTQAVLQISTTATTCKTAATSRHLSPTITTAFSTGDFSYMVQPIWSPALPPLEATQPPLIIWAPSRGLTNCTARSYCTPCIYKYILTNSSSSQILRFQSPEIRHFIDEFKICIQNPAFPNVLEEIYKKSFIGKIITTWGNNLTLTTMESFYSKLPSIVEVFKSQSFLKMSVFMSMCQWTIHRAFVHNSIRNSTL
jgi:hypothetical protein